MLAYIKYKAYYEKKIEASKLKEQQIIQVLQPTADHQGSKIPLTVFRWKGPYVVEKALLNYYYLN